MEQYKDLVVLRKRAKDSHACVFSLDMINSLTDGAKRALYEQLLNDIEKMPPMTADAGFWYTLGALEQSLGLGNAHVSTFSAHTHGTTNAT